MDIKIDSGSVAVSGTEVFSTAKELDAHIHALQLARRDAFPYPWSLENGKPFPVLHAPTVVGTRVYFAIEMYRVETDDGEGKWIDNEASEWSDDEFIIAGWFPRNSGT